MKENYIRTLRESVRRVQEWQPLTFRGLLCLVASAWSLYAFAIPESDLIAFITGGSILGLSVLCVLTALLLRFRLRKRLQVQAFFSPGENTVGNEIASGIVLTGAELPPFFTLRIKRILDHPGIIARIHLVAGAESRKNLVDSVAFPHRGVWNLIGFDFSLHDALGLCSIRWRVSHSAPVEVSARVLPIQPLPIMAASSRSGDQLNHSQERSGDLFDIKAYDPSDGITRVLWKTYARSAQLVVRRPEPAVVPEGEVAIYVVAREDEDYVVGAFLSYLEELERGNITVIFGTDGLRDATGIAAGVAGGFVTSPATIRTALNRTVWHEDTGSGRGILQYLAATNEQNRSISRLIVFGSEASEEWFGQISQAAASHHVALNVVIVPKAVDALADFYSRSGNASLTERLRNVVWSKPRTLPPAYLGGRLAQSGAEVILCQRNDVIL